jgi:CheY-like chemotaxis protein
LSSAGAFSSGVISLRGDPNPGRSNAGDGAQRTLRKSYHPAIGNSWRKIRLAVEKARAALPPTAMSEKILLVDDECSIREALGKLLRAENYKVELAENGEDAVERYGSDHIDLVILDLNLPVKNGWATLEWLTKINPGLPVIIITGRSDQRELAVKAGADALMEKPLDVPFLLQTIRELLAKPVESRVRRTRAAAPGFRYASCDTFLLREMLLKRLTTPYQSSGAESTSPSMRYERNM